MASGAVERSWGEDGEEQRPLTPRQEDLVKTVATIEQTGGVPIVRDLTAAMNIGRTTFQDLLNQTKTKGYLKVDSAGRGTPIVVKLTDKGRALTKRPGIPILGCIPAGPTQSAQQAEVIRYIETLDDIFPDRRDDDFGLEVAGYSMYPELQPRDVVLFSKHETPIDGDICALYVGDEHCSTIKRIHYSDGGRTITLEAVNPDYDSPEVCAAQVTIVGVAMHMVRPQFRRKRL